MEVAKIICDRFTAQLTKSKRHLACSIYRMHRRLFFSVITCQTANSSNRTFFGCSINETGINSDGKWNRQNNDDDVRSVCSLSWDSYDLTWPNKPSKFSGCRHQCDVIVPTQHVDSLRSVTSLRSLDSRYSTSASGRRSSSGDLAPSVSMRSFTDDKTSNSNFAVDDEPPSGSLSGYVPSSSGSEQLENHYVVIDRQGETEVPVSSNEQIQPASRNSSDPQQLRSDRKQKAASGNSRRCWNPADAASRNRKDRRMLVVEVDDERDGDIQGGRRRHDVDLQLHPKSTDPVTSLWRGRDVQSPIHGSAVSSECRPKSAIDFRLCISEETSDVNVTSSSLLFASTSSIYVRSSSLVDLSSGSSEPSLTFGNPKALRLAKGFFNSVCAAYSSKALDNESRFPSAGQQTKQCSPASVHRSRAANDAVVFGSDRANQSRLDGGRRARCADFQYACDQQLPVDATVIRANGVLSDDLNSGTEDVENERVKIDLFDEPVDSPSNQYAASDADSESSRDSNFRWPTTSDDGNARELEIETASAAATVEEMVTSGAKAVIDEIKRAAEEHKENWDGFNLYDCENEFRREDCCEDSNDGDGCEKTHAMNETATHVDVIGAEGNDNSEAREPETMIASHEKFHTKEDERFADERSTDSFCHASKHDPRSASAPLNGNKTSSTSGDKKATSVPVDNEEQANGKDCCSSTLTGMIDMEKSRKTEVTDASGAVFDVGSKTRDRSSAGCQIDIGGDNDERRAKDEQAGNRCKAISPQPQREVSALSPACVRCVATSARQQNESVITSTRGDENDRIIMTRKHALTGQLLSHCSPKTQSIADDIGVEKVKNGGANETEVETLKADEFNKNSTSRLKSYRSIIRTSEQCPADETAAMVDQSKTVLEKINSADNKSRCDLAGGVLHTNCRYQEHFADAPRTSQQGQNQLNSKVLASGTDKLSSYDAQFDVALMTVASSIRSIPPNEPAIVETREAAAVSGKLAHAQTNVIMGRGDTAADYKKRQTSATIGGCAKVPLIRGKQEIEAVAAAQCEVGETQSNVKHRADRMNNLCSGLGENNKRTKICSPRTQSRSKTFADIDEVAPETVNTSASIHNRSPELQQLAEMSLSLSGGKPDAEEALYDRRSVNEDDKTVTFATFESLPLTGDVKINEKQEFSGENARPVGFSSWLSDQSDAANAPRTLSDEPVKSMTSSTERMFSATSVSNRMKKTPAERQSLAISNATGCCSCRGQESISEQSRRTADRIRVSRILHDPCVPGVPDVPGGVRCGPSRIPRPMSRTTETMICSLDPSTDRRRTSHVIADIEMTSYRQHVPAGNDESVTPCPRATNSVTKAADRKLASGGNQHGDKSVVSVSATVSTTIRGSESRDVLEYRRIVRRSMEARWKALWRRARLVKWRRPRGDWRTATECGNMAEDEQWTVTGEDITGWSTHRTDTNLKQSPSKLPSTARDMKPVALKSDCASTDFLPEIAQSVPKSNAYTTEVMLGRETVSDAIKNTMSSDAGDRDQRPDFQLHRVDNSYLTTTMDDSVYQTGIVGFSPIFTGIMENATKNIAVTFKGSSAALNVSKNHITATNLQGESNIRSQAVVAEEMVRNTEQLQRQDSTSYVSNRTASSPAVVDKHLAHRAIADDDIEYDRRWSTGNIQYHASPQFSTDSSTVKGNADKMRELAHAEIDIEHRGGPMDEVLRNHVTTAVGGQSTRQSGSQFRRSIFTEEDKTKHVVGTVRENAETTRLDVEHRRSEQVRLFNNRQEVEHRVAVIPNGRRDVIRIVASCGSPMSQRSTAGLNCGRKRKSAKQLERCQLRVNFSNECHECDQPRGDNARHKVTRHSADGTGDACCLKMAIVSFLSNMRRCDGMDSRYVIRSCCSVAESLCRSATAVNLPVAATNDLSVVSTRQAASTKIVSPTLEMSQRPPRPRACTEMPVSQSRDFSGDCCRYDDDRDRDRIRSRHVGASVTQIVTRSRRSSVSSLGDRCSRSVDGKTEWMRHMNSRIVHFKSTADVGSEEHLIRSREQSATSEDVVVGIANKDDHSNVSYDEPQCNCGMFSDRDRLSKIFLTGSPRFTGDELFCLNADDRLKDSLRGFSDEIAATPGGERSGASKQLLSVIVGHCRFAGRRLPETQLALHKHADVGTSVSGQRRRRDSATESACAAGCLPMPGLEKVRDDRRRLEASGQMLAKHVLNSTGSAAAAVRSS